MISIVEEELISDMSDDEKLYHQYEKEFRQKVRDIERREMIRVTDGDHKRYIEIIRAEYKKRKNDK